MTVHDFNHRLVAETMERATRWSHALWFERDIRTAKAVFTNSQGTADRMWRYVGRKADAILRPAVGVHFSSFDADACAAAPCVLAEWGVRAPYILAVSTLEPRKNMGALVDAFMMLRKAGHLPDHQLVLVGSGGWKNSRLAMKIRDAIGIGVVLPGYVPDAAMPAMYALADMLIMPSIYEGFGMPVLEARCMGIPVVTTDVPELREAAGDCAFVVGSDATSIARGIRDVLAANGRNSSVVQPIPRWRDTAALFVQQLAQLVPDSQPSGATAVMKAASRAAFGASQSVDGWSSRCRRTTDFGACHDE